MVATGRAATLKSDRETWRCVGGRKTEEKDLSALVKSLAENALHSEGERALGEGKTEAEWQRCSLGCECTGRHCPTARRSSATGHC